MKINTNVDQVALRLILLGTLAASLSMPSGSQAFSSSSERLQQTTELAAINGMWIYVEDRTEGRSPENMSPPMGSYFSFRVEDGAVVLATGHGGARRDVRVPLDGKTHDVPSSQQGQTAQYRAWWKDGAFTYEIEFIRTPGSAPVGLIKREFRPTKEGLIVRSNLGTGTEFGPVALYRHPEDIPMPTPTKATINDVAWLSGAWTGSRGTSGTTTIEERWSPAQGGSMLGVSRTISRGKMSAFEYLRIVERDGGLVYVAQPNGGTTTEFILTEFSATKAVFENPRHDYPKRIAYELGDDGVLRATIGFLKGGTPGRFEYKRESK